MTGISHSRGDKKSCGRVRAVVQPRAYAQCKPRTLNRLQIENNQAHALFIKKAARFEFDFGALRSEAAAPDSDLHVSREFTQQPAPGNELVKQEPVPGMLTHLQAPVAAGAADVVVAVLCHGAAKTGRHGVSS